MRLILYNLENFIINYYFPKVLNYDILYKFISGFKILIKFRS